MTPKSLYKADVKNPKNDGKKFYLGVTKTPFKEHFGNHPHQTSQIQNSTELSKYIWKLKDDSISPVIEWSIVTETQLNFFKLLLSQKIYIINSLNDHSDRKDTMD